jgi:hypothetical protein
MSATKAGLAPSGRLQPPGFRPADIGHGREKMLHCDLLYANQELLNHLDQPLLQDHCYLFAAWFAERVLVDRPSFPERFSRRWWVCQFMVSVTLTGLRLASAVADGSGGISRRPATEDGGAINSRRLRLALVREMTLQ